MTRRALASITLIVATGLLAGGCRGAVTPLPTPEVAAVQAGAMPSQGVRPSDHVIVISIDGLRPDAIDRYEARTLAAMAAEGSYSYRATTVSPSRTLPSHVSMLTGVEPSVHGVVWNTDERMSRGPVGVPTVFGEAHRAGLTTAAFFAKTKFVHLVVPGTLTHVQLPRFGMLGPRAASQTLDLLSDHLEHTRPNLLFVHLAEPDAAGHVYGWMTSMYGVGVRAADEAVRHIVALADRAFGRGRYTIIVTADHGGHGRDHGSDAGADGTIPWIAWGRGVYKGGPLAADVRTVDTAASILWLLGLDVPSSWSGQVVTGAFSPRR